MRIASRQVYVGGVHLKLVRSGGLTGVSLVASLDSGDLSAYEQGLVADLLVEETPAQRGDQPGGADQFSYQLEINQGDHIFGHRWGETEVPAAIRPLLAVLVHKAKPEGKPPH